MLISRMSWRMSAGPARRPPRRRDHRRQRFGNQRDANGLRSQPGQSLACPAHWEPTDRARLTRRSCYWEPRASTTYGAKHSVGAEGREFWLATRPPPEWATNLTSAHQKLASLATPEAKLARRLLIFNHHSGYLSEAAASNFDW